MAPKLSKRWSTFVTPQERDVQRALEAFWYEHYTKEYDTSRRNELVEEFAFKWLDNSKIKADRPFIRHPATKKRQYNREYTVGEILADFIMRVDQVEERSKEYPISNPDHKLTGERDREAQERAIFFQWEEDALDKERGETVPPYSVKESDFAQDCSIEDILFSEEVPCVKAFRGRLRKVKRFAEFYATSFAEEYGYDKREILRRIRVLNLDRVRECLVCGGAFYARDMRMIYCDCQQDKGSIRSTCQRIANNSGYLVQEKSII
ncbi:hypothetical protein [Halalkalibacter urbisdiaboli]|uniref:hypothetical protein n=1 Tax=Halalkalibacter urbisdiaboli TaxID=1960589 RepID=UPI000B43071F|nr:hypothetical protein [Halalkalibacter urbisdiaboli]